MAFPTNLEYRQALQRPELCVAANFVRQMEIATDLWNGYPNLIVGQSSVVSKFVGRHSTKALKLFTIDRPQRVETLNRLSGKIDSARCPYLIPFDLDKKGITIDRMKLPTVTMEWLDGQNFWDFLVNASSDPDVLLELAQQLVDASSQFAKLRYTHGKVSGNDLIVQPTGRLRFFGQESATFKSEQPNAAENRSLLALYLNAVSLAIDPSLVELVPDGRLCPETNSEESPFFSNLLSHRSPVIQNLAQYLASVENGGVASVRLEACPFLIPQAKLTAVPAWISELAVNTDGIATEVRSDEMVADSSTAITNLESIAAQVKPLPLSVAVLCVLLIGLCATTLWHLHLLQNLPIAASSTAATMLAAYYIAAYMYNNQEPVKKLNAAIAETANQFKLLEKRTSELQGHISKLAVDRGAFETKLQQKYRAIQTDFRSAEEALSKLRAELDDARTKLAIAKDKAITVLVQSEQSALGQIEKLSEQATQSAREKVSQIQQDEENRSLERLQQAQSRYQQEFLARHRITSAAIMTINDSMKGKLIGAGIITAADVTAEHLAACEFITLSRTKALLDWRESVEQQMIITTPTVLSPEQKDSVIRELRIEIERAEKEVARVRAESERATRDYRNLYVKAGQRLDEHFSNKDAALQEQFQMQMARAQGRLERCRKQLGQCEEHLKSEGERLERLEQPLSNALEGCKRELSYMRRALANCHPQTFGEYVARKLKVAAPSGGQNELA